MEDRIVLKSVKFSRSIMLDGKNSNTALATELKYLAFDESAESVFITAKNGKQFIVPLTNVDVMEELTEKDAADWLAADGQDLESK